jgi:DNA-binding transcriptional LysR family regulator
MVGQLHVGIRPSPPRMPMNFRTLDLNLLRVFDVVMAERHVTRAAERLSMTQPAVSNALRRLREAIGEELFVPGPTGVTPTRQADALWPAVRGALRSLREAIEPEGFDPQRDARSFTVAMADATAAVLVPPLIAAWTREGVRSELRVVGLDTRDPRPLLEQGAADAALGFFPDVARELAAEGERGNTRLDALYDCDYVCVMRRGHPLAAQSALSLDAYCEALHLRVSFAGRPRGYVDEALARLARTRRVVLTLDHFSTAGRVVAGSDLLTVLPRSFVPATGHAQQLACAALPFELPGIRVGLLWHRRHEHDAGRRWLRAALAQSAAGRAAANASVCK